MFQSLGSPGFSSDVQLARKNAMNYRTWPYGRSCCGGGRDNVLTNIFRREVHGTELQKLENPFGDNGTPARLRMPIEEIIPAAALEAGNIFMGFTNCGRYLISYTCRPTEHFGASVFDSDASYIYTLHIWLFTPYTRIRKVSQVCLFDNNGVYDNNLLIEISQWDMDDDHLLITGYSANPDTETHHTFYSTITTIPGTKNCPNCVYMHDEELEEDMAFNSRLRTNCVLHGLTLHLKFDHVPPFPKLNPDVQLRFKDTVLLNTGNVIHMVSYRLIRPKPVKPETLSLVPAAGAMISTSKVPLRCDIWFKTPNSNLGALSTVKSIAQDSRHDAEENIYSLNTLDSILSLFPNSSTSKSYLPPHQHSTLTESQVASLRRLSQSSTDSDSLFSPKSISTCDCMSPMSPPFLNKPRSPRQNEGISQGMVSSTNVSPSKLMLPPQERKFFKRRLSSHSLVSSTSGASANSNNNSNIGNINNICNAPIPSKRDDEVTSTESKSPLSQPQSPFDVFEMRLEDTAVERHLSSFKTFRKRRLADKKYEFNDADNSAENIVPLKMTRRSKPKYSQGLGMPNPRSPRNENENTVSGNESPRGTFSDMSHPRSPRAYHIMSPIMSPNYNYDSSVSDVLRPLNTNFSKVKVTSLSPNNNSGVLDTEDGKMKEENELKDFKDCANQYPPVGLKKSECLEATNHPHSKPTLSVNVNCIAKVLRSYIQKEDDNMSVITDIEDDMCQGYPFPVALPLEVHGAGYQQLQMISNAKAEKFQVPVVQVLQRTLDIEMLCNEVANLICIASDKHYCSCMDFDLTFADANPDRGTVVIVVVMLVQATNLKMKGRVEKLNVFSQQDVRKKYEAVFVGEWIPNREHCRILYKSNLKELETVPDPWHPTENMESILKTHLKTFSSKKTLSNSLAVHDWQSLDELVDSYGIVALIKDEGSTEKTDRRLNEYNNLIYGNNIDLASVTSTTTDSDDEWGM